MGTSSRSAFGMWPRLIPLEQTRDVMPTLLQQGRRPGTDQHDARLLLHPRGERRSLRRRKPLVLSLAGEAPRFRRPSPGRGSAGQRARGPRPPAGVGPRWPPPCPTAASPAHPGPSPPRPRVRPRPPGGRWSRVERRREVDGHGLNGHVPVCPRSPGGASNASLCHSRCRTACPSPRGRLSHTPRKHMPALVVARLTSKCYRQPYRCSVR